MSEITLAGRKFDTTQFSTTTHSLMVAVQFSNQEIERLTRRISVLQTARNAYAKALSKALPTDANIADGERTVKVNDREYAWAALSDSAKNQFTSLRKTITELAKVEQELMIAKTASSAYFNDFKATLFSE